MRQMVHPLLDDADAVDPERGAPGDRLAGVGEGDNLSFTERWERRIKRVWYTPPGKTCQYFLVEVFKLILNGAFFTGVANGAFWASCGFPAEQEQTMCDSVGYKDLRTAEMLFVLVMTMVTAMLREQRRRVELIPNLSVHQRLTLALRTTSNAPLQLNDLRDLELAMSHSYVEEGDQLHAIQGVRAKLSEMKNRVSAMESHLALYKRFRLEASCYFKVNEAIRIPVGAFLGFSVAMLLLLQRAAISSESNYIWHANPMTEFGVFSWISLVVATIAGALLNPDDLSAQNDDLKHKLLAQYGTLAGRCKAEKLRICSELSAIEPVYERMLTGGYGFSHAAGEALGKLKEPMRSLRHQVELLDTREYLRSDRGIISAGKTARAIRLGL